MRSCRRSLRSAPAVFALLLAGCPAAPSAGPSENTSDGGHFNVDGAHGAKPRHDAGVAGMDGAGGGASGHAGSGGATGTGGKNNNDAGSAGKDAGSDQASTGAGAAMAGGTGANSGTAGDSGPGADSGDTSITPVSCAPVDAVGMCGNGAVDPGESCDGTDLRGLSCASLDPFFTGGTLRCATNCTLDTNQCIHGTCGNGVIDPGEDCEYASFAQLSCSDLLPGSDNALVGCSPGTCRYDVTNCSAASAPTSVCGNGIREAGEQCDGADRFFRSCGEYAYEYTGGTFGCNPATCMIDLTQCTRCDGTRCGDGVINGGEQCDGDDLGPRTCADDDRAFGTVSCLSNCNVDYSQCYGGCTIYKGKIISCN